MTTNLVKKEWLEARKQYSNLLDARAEKQRVEGVDAILADVEFPKIEKELSDRIADLNIKMMDENKESYPQEFFNKINGKASASHDHGYMICLECKCLFEPSMEFKWRHRESFEGCYEHENKFENKGKIELKTYNGGGSIPMFTRKLKKGEGKC